MKSASRLGSATSNRRMDAPWASTAARIESGSVPGRSSSSEPSASLRTASTPGRVLTQSDPSAGLDGEAHGSPSAGALQVADTSTRHQPAVVHDRDGFAQRLGRLHLVRREDQRPSAVPELHERLSEQDQVDGIEPGEGLVHQEDLGVVEDGRDELDLLLVALRQLLCPSVGVLGDAEAAQPADRGSPGAVGRLAVQRGEVDKLVEHGHPRHSRPRSSGR